jgi:hypothetical protein
LSAVQGSVEADEFADEFDDDEFDDDELICNKHTS